MIIITFSICANTNTVYTQTYGHPKHALAYMLTATLNLMTTESIAVSQLSSRTFMNEHLLGLTTDELMPGKEMEKWHSAQLK